MPKWLTIRAVLKKQGYSSFPPLLLRQYPHLAPIRPPPPRQLLHEIIRKKGGNFNFWRNLNFGFLLPPLLLSFRAYASRLLHSCYFLSGHLVEERERELKKERKEKRKEKERKA